MANLCFNFILISGSKNDIRALRIKIEKQDEILIDIFPWFKYTKYDYGLYEGTLAYTLTSISFSFGSKWCFPIDEFRNLIQRYPQLSFEGEFEESAMEIFGRFEAKGGSYNISNISPLDYYTDHYEDFKEEREYIETLPYEKFLKHVLETDYNDQEDSIPYCYLEPLILKKIKKKDLPLFVNYNWFNKENYINLSFLEAIWKN